MTNVKICGITTKEDALMAVNAGADMVGVIINVPVETPRRIGFGDGKNILKLKDLSDVLKVAVLMPNTVDEIDNVFDELQPDLIQLHGNESLEFVENIKSSMDVGIIKAVHVDNSELVIDKAINYSKVADMILLDTKFRDRIGGTGTTHNWNISRKIKDSIKCPLILSGGLNPENVLDAISMVNPDVVDVSSGVESTPGRKDPDMIRKFIEAVKGGTSG